jgi:leader peptidase (prepilin peptidase)/N-methyltransferase
VPVLIAAVTLLGLAIGSFLNVVIYRVPAGVSLLRPSSRCPACEQPIRNRHNLPVVGWLILRGRCADCKTGISPRYPLVEFATAALFVVMTWQLHRLQLLAALPAYLYFIAIGIVLTMIDIDVHRLPNAIVWPSYPVLAIALTVGALASGHPEALLRSAIGAAALFAFYELIARIYPAGMGFGDVNLAGLIGGVLGYLSYSALFVGAFAAFLLGGLFSMVAIGSGRATRKSGIPFGPFMIIGALTAIFVSDPLWHLYSNFVLNT